MHLYGVRFVLQMGHEPLKYMNSAKFTNNWLMQWAMFLQSYIMKMEVTLRKEISLLLLPAVLNYVWKQP